MDTYEILCMIALIITHAGMYYLGKTASVEVRKHAIDKQIEYWKWLEERKDRHAQETESAAQGGD